MKRKRRTVGNRILLFLLIASLIFPNLATFAATSEGDTTTLIACSDFQHPDGHDAGKTQVQTLLSTLSQNGVTSADGMIFCGDYDYGYTDSAGGVTALKEAFSGVVTSDMVMVQGNHDDASTEGLSPSGNNDPSSGEYGVFVINEDDYMWYNNDKTRVRQTAQNLADYLNDKISAQYDRPIFVVSHLQLHYSMRTANYGDGMYAKYIFDVLNQAGSRGLNIIFMHGHNHSDGWDDYLGGAAVYLKKGDDILIAQNSKTNYQSETLNFTYMNAGYVGYYTGVNDGADTALTMTTFDISNDQVTINRYDENGLHNLKSAGVTNAYNGESGYSPNTTVYASSQEVALTQVTDTTPIEGPGTSEEDGTKYVRIDTASQLTHGGKYLMIAKWDGGGNKIMLPSVVTKTDSNSSARRGFDVEDTSVFGSSTVWGEYSNNEWTFQKTNNGWYIGNGGKNIKFTETSDMAITATLENQGDILTIDGEGTFQVGTDAIVLNANSRGLVNGYATGPIEFYIYENNAYNTDIADGILEHQEGSVAMSYQMLDTTGDIPVPTSDEYSNYLFAGWYTSADCTMDTAIKNSAQVSETSFAKFIPADVLTVKAQVSTSKMPEGSEQAGKWAMRFTSSVDGVNYKKVGFKVTDGTREYTSASGSVYTKIVSAETETKCTFSPRVISECSEYFFTAKLAVADTTAGKATDYTVQAYVETLDGTIVYGPKRVVAANDGLSGNTLNMVVRADLNGTNYTATYSTDNEVKTMSDPVEVTVLSSDAGYSNIRIPVSQGLGELFAASKVIISDENGAVATEVYRNYYANHGRSYQDISWYYVEPTANEFLLASSAELYGLEAMAYRGITFEGQTIELVSDVVINEGTAIPGNGSTAPSWSDNDSTIHKWIPIGNFNGTFDGNGNTISGIYLDNSSTKTGFFKTLSAEAEVMNLAIVNSYIKSNDNDYAGVLAGQSHAKLIKNVYSDAVIDCGNCTGGLVGLLEPISSETECAFEECWFDGEIYVSGYGGTGGGLVGYVYDTVSGKIRFSDCLYSGDLYKAGRYNYPNYGGFVGDNPDKGQMTQFTFENCLNTGGMTKVKSTDGGGWGGFISYGSYWLQGGTMTNCYAVENTVYGNQLTGHASSGVTSTNSGVVSRDTLLFTTEAGLLEKLPLLSGQTESAWMCDTLGDTTGTPILKGFAHIWSK